MKIEHMPIDQVKPYEGNPRRISDYSVAQVAESLKAYGFQQPLVVDKDCVLIVGHVRLMAAQSLGLTHVPVLRADLTEDKAIAYRLADNRTSELTGWQTKDLTAELAKLSEGFEIPGFTLDEIKLLKELQGTDTPSPETVPSEPSEPVDEPPEERSEYAQLVLFVPRAHLRELKAACQALIDGFQPGG